MTEIAELCPSLPHPFSLLIMNAREFLDGSNRGNPGEIQVYTPPPAVYRQNVAGVIEIAERPHHDKNITVRPGPVGPGECRKGDYS